MAVTFMRPNLWILVVERRIERLDIRPRYKLCKIIVMGWTDRQLFCVDTTSESASDEN